MVQAGDNWYRIDIGNAIYLTKFAHLSLIIWRQKPVCIYCFIIYLMHESKYFGVLFSLEIYF